MGIFVVFILHTYIVLMSQKLDVEWFIHVRDISRKKIRKSSMMTYWDKRGLLRIKGREASL